MKITKISLISFAVLLSIILATNVLAVLKSTTYNGKTYYVVTSTDTSEDTGNEVCTKIGKVCVGYTAFTTDVCKKFHPDASVTTSVHGSKVGFYCNGPPQKGLACENSYNNCQICPACNVNADCNFEIGGLFREMYVECTGTTTSSKIKTYYELIQDLQKCPNCESNKKIPSNFRNLFGNNLVQIIIITNSGIDFFYAETKDGNIQSFERGLLLVPGPNIKIASSQQVIDRILRSSDLGAETQLAIKNGEIKIEFVSISLSSIFAKFGIGFIRLFGNPVTPTPPSPIVVTDKTGTSTPCNIKWDGPKQISCDGAYQAQGTGYGQGCCELDCGADSACDEQSSGALTLKGQCNDECKVDTYQFKPPFNLTLKPTTDSRIGQHPGNVVCEFYQTTLPSDPVKSNHKHATCAAYKAADHFCVIVMQSQYARAAKCEEQGIIVCTNPCKPPTYQLPIKQCAFEAERPRGYQASPLTFCDGPYTGNTGPGPAPPGTKKPGEICQHGGECTTGNCVGEGPPYGQVYKCSCNPFRLDYSCLNQPQPQPVAPRSKNPGDVCVHGGECRTGNCVGVGQGPPWTYKCSCNPFRYEPFGC